jgi:formate dehydrogenase gamma subunit
MEKADILVGGKIKRFSLFRITEHFLNMVVFTLLAITGLSQKFYEYGFSQWLIMNLGGVDSVRLIHRYAGILFAILTVSHILIASIGVIFRKWQATMVINRKDFTDAVDNLKYYFGLTDHPARCDRYDYKQKFEYWGVIVGGLLMIGTGFVLWFPAFIARYLPGEFIPAAKAAHTNEALLAFLVIIVWHMYNAVFSPEVFPLDTAIFTGRISAKRMKHEHPLEYERITGEFQENIFPEGESEIQQESDLSP